MEEVSKHYNSDYFTWQKKMGEFGGWADLRKFDALITKKDIVCDFGCGGGFLLAHLDCAKRIGIEPNTAVSETLEKNNIQHFISPANALEELGEESIDVIISSNALEHTLNPLEEIKKLYPLLKKNGKICFVVPCDSIYNKFNAMDINHHLFSWSPMNLGHLFMEAGYTVISSEKYIHKWPPYYEKIAKFGWPIFNIVCKIYEQIERSWFQTKIIAIK